MRVWESVSSQGQSLSPLTSQCKCIKRCLGTGCPTTQFLSIGQKKSPPYGGYRQQSKEWLNKHDQTMKTLQYFDTYNQDNNTGPTLINAHVIDVHSSRSHAHTLFVHGPVAT